jgi:hypothetical protein
MQTATLARQQKAEPQQVLDILLHFPGFVYLIHMASRVGIPSPLPAALRSTVTGRRDHSWPGSLRARAANILIVALATALLLALVLPKCNGRRLRRVYLNPKAFLSVGKACEPKLLPSEALPLAAGRFAPTWAQQVSVVC